MAVSLKREPEADEARIEVTKHGLRFGALSVDCVCTLPRGGAAVRLETPKIALNVRVTKTGKMIVTSDQGIELMVSR